MFYFTLLLLEPKRDQEKVSREKISLDELKQFSHYLEEQTTKGIPVKARISIYEEDTKKGSIALSTNRDGTDVLEILLARVSQPDILRYLAENRGKQTSIQKEKQLLEEKKENDSQEDINICQTIKPVNLENSLSEEQLEPVVENGLDEKRKINSDHVHVYQIPALKEEKKPKRFKRWLFVGSMVVLFLLNVFLFFNQMFLSIRVNEWQNHVENQVELLENHSQIDTTSRFFLANYYSSAEEEQYKEGLKKFVGVSMENWGRPSDELNSMFLYEIKEEKKGIKVSYLLTLTGEKTTQLKQISFFVKIKKGKILIVSQPQMEEFSW